MTARWALGPLPWQGDRWSQMEPLLMADRLPHALLLAGPAGIGKLQFLQALAARLLCKTPANGTPCGNCHSCELLVAGSHADLLWVKPEGDSRAIKVAQVRELIEFAGKTPSLGTRKVILLGPAEVTNHSAANAMLKCLEEPSASTTLLLYSHQPSGLPATVRSRCQILAMRVPTRAEVLGWLAQLAGDEAEAETLLDLCSGLPLQARELLSEGGLDQRRLVQRGIAELLEGRLTPLQFPSLVTDLQLEEVLALLQQAAETRVRQRLQESDWRGSRRQILSDLSLQEDLARMRRSIANGANPNRQLIIEDYSARLSSSLSRGKR